MATIQSIGSFQPIRESGNGKDLPETSFTHNTAGSVAVENVKQTNQVVAPQQPEGSAKAKDGLGAEELQQQLEKFAQSEQTIRRSPRYFNSNRSLNRERALLFLLFSLYLAEYIGVFLIY
jgi:hypothetical protein